MRKIKAALIGELDWLRAELARREDVPCGKPERALLGAVASQMLDNASTVIFIKDLDGRYLLVSRRFEERGDIRNDEVVGKADFDLFPPPGAGQEPELAALKTSKLYERQSGYSREFTRPSCGSHWMPAVRPTETATFTPQSSSLE